MPDASNSGAVVLTLHKLRSHREVKPGAYLCLTLSGEWTVRRAEPGSKSLWDELHEPAPFGDFAAVYRLK